MPIPTFTEGYPPDGSTLGETKTTIRNNLDGTFQTLSVDHINNNGDPGAKPAGYHNVIHVVPQGSNPAAVAGYGQLFSKTITSGANDQALFWETGGGLIQQLTVNITPSASANGYTFLPGGLIMQWGFRSGAFSGGSATGSVTFPLAFPTACYMVNTTPVYQATGNTGGGLPGDTGTVGVNNVAGQPSTSGFQWNFRSNSSKYTGFYWTAIGK